MAAPAPRRAGVDRPRRSPVRTGEPARNDPRPYNRALREARARRRARIEHEQERKRARVRFFALLFGLLFLTLFIGLSIWEKIEALFGL